MKIFLGICLLAFAIPLLILPVRISEAQDVILNTTAFFSDIPRSNQRPSQAGVIGVSVATVGLVVFSCSFVFILGMYEECCSRGSSTNTRSAKVGSRYGGSRYGKGRGTAAADRGQYKPPRPVDTPHATTSFS